MPPCNIPEEIEEQSAPSPPFFQTIAQLNPIKCNSKYLGFLDMTKTKSVTFCVSFLQIVTN